MASGRHRIQDRAREFTGGRGSSPGGTGCLKLLKVQCGRHPYSGARRVLVILFLVVALPRVGRAPGRSVAAVAGLVFDWSLLRWVPRLSNCSRVVSVFYVIEIMEVLAIACLSVEQCCL